LRRRISSRSRFIAIRNSQLSNRPSSVYWPIRATIVQNVDWEISSASSALPHWARINPNTRGP
jgi:hypothetical protein